MPSLAGLVLPFLLSVLFCTLIGLPLARRVFPVSLADYAAPATGWGVFCLLANTCLADPVPFGTLSVDIALAVAASIALLALRASRIRLLLPIWQIAVSAALGVLPASAVLPSHAESGGVLLPPPMFDHVKIAIVDSITRAGLPPRNPFWLDAAHPTLAYYYLWHEGAAFLSAALHVSGWTADAASTWFTAYASLMLIMGLARVWGAPFWVAGMAALISLAGSLRPILEAIAGSQAAQAILSPSADIGAWLNQASWVPQHLASGTLAVLAAIAIQRLRERPGAAIAVVTGLLTAASFASSVWAGGIAFFVAAAAEVTFLLIQPAPARGRFLLYLTLAAASSVSFAIPFAHAQIAGLSARTMGFPIAVMPYSAFGSAIAPPWRGIADALSFWPLFIPFCFPALLAGFARPAQSAACPLQIFAFGCLATSWLLRSTIENNDLGWRAPIPAILILAPLSALAWHRWWWTHKARAVAFAMIGALGFFSTGAQIVLAISGQPSADAKTFAMRPSLWRSVRDLTNPADRIANNPLMDATITPWPDNIGWALLSDRPSCYSGWATMVAYANLPKPALLAANALFLRVFNGTGTASDLAALSGFGCRYALVTREDGAWMRDPFAASPLASLSGRGADWRLYRLGN